VILPRRVSLNYPCPARLSAGGCAEKNMMSITRNIKARAFTLLEMLLALAIIALIATVLVGASANLLNQQQPVSADDVFWKAVQAARKAALLQEHEVQLKFATDDMTKAKEFLLLDGDATKEFPIKDPGDLEVSFLVAQKGGNMIMIGGTALETQTVPVVKFYADGTCSQFRIQFFRNGAAHQLAIDPWTCAPVLTPSDPNAPSAQ
jgi:prepilin-type N-terminal cleavage/methylation domain-containing protein